MGFPDTGRILLLRISLFGLRALPTTSATTRDDRRSSCPTVDRRLDALVAEVTLDHRQRDTGLDEPLALVCRRSCKRGRLGQALRPWPGLSPGATRWD